jgi:hypothetical protein
MDENEVLAGDVSVLEMATELTATGDLRLKALRGRLAATR